MPSGLSVTIPILPLLGGGGRALLRWSCHPLANSSAIGVKTPPTTSRSPWRPLAPPPHHHHCRFRTGVYSGPHLFGDREQHLQGQVGRRWVPAPPLPYCRLLRHVGRQWAYSNPGCHTGRMTNLLQYCIIFSLSFTRVFTVAVMWHRSCWVHRNHARLSLWLWCFYPDFLACWRAIISILFSL